VQGKASLSGRGDNALRVAERNAGQRDCGLARPACGAFARRPVRVPACWRSPAHARAKRASAVGSEGARARSRPLAPARTRGGGIAARTSVDDRPLLARASLLLSCLLGVARACGRSREQSQTGHATASAPEQRPNRVSSPAPISSPYACMACMRIVMASALARPRSHVRTRALAHAGVGRQPTVAHAACARTRMRAM